MIKICVDSFEGLGLCGEESFAHYFCEKYFSEGNFVLLIFVEVHIAEIKFFELS